MLTLIVSAAPVFAVSSWNSNRKQHKFGAWVNIRGVVGTLTNGILRLVLDNQETRKCTKLVNFMFMAISLFRLE